MALVNYYRLNGNANDSIGANNGTISGATSKPSMGLNGCYYWNGSSYISSSAVVPSAITISVGIMFTVDGGNWALLSTYVAGTENSTYLIMVLNSGTLAFEWRDRNDSGTYNQYTVNITNFTKDVWHHIIVVQATPNTTPEFWLNGKQYTLSTYKPITAVRGTGLMKLGMLNTTGNWGFTGYIDEVRIYNHAMTAGEVKNLYISYKGLI